MAIAFATPEKGVLKSFSWSDGGTFYFCTIDPPLELEPGDTPIVTIRNGKANIRIHRYEDDILEREWEVFQ